MQVSKRCSVSLQQIHKYETGQSNVSVPMLVKLARCLDVPIGYFLEEVEEVLRPGQPEGPETVRP